MLYKSLKVPLAALLQDYHFENSDTFKRAILHWVAEQETGMFLDSSAAAGKWQFLAAAGVHRQLQCSAGNAFAQLRQWYDEQPGWLFGALAYDLKNEVEHLQSAHFDGIQFPDLYFFQPEIVLGLREGQVEVYSLLLAPESVIFEMRNAECGVRNEGDGEMRNAECGMRNEGAGEMRNAECGMRNEGDGEMRNAECGVRNEGDGEMRNAECGVRNEGDGEMRNAECGVRNEGDGEMRNAECGVRNEGEVRNDEVPQTPKHENTKTHSAFPTHSAFRTPHSALPPHSALRIPHSALLSARMPRAEYLSTVARIREHIIEGDLYEMNLCQEFYATPIQIDPLAVYERLSALAQAPAGAWFRLADKYLLCASPERFIQKRSDKLISQPIKGTRRRSADPPEDESIKQELYHSIKDRAENVMIVDLVRNDLARHCLPGSVQVEELFGIYTFNTVHQMISTVSGRLRPDTHPIDALRDAFPMGSMTGAPKVMAMQLIERYERSRRGLYSGAVGYIDPAGDFDFNVVIRSIQYNAKEQYLSVSAGGAIVYDSEAEQEYEECLLKTKVMREALGMA